MSTYFGSAAWESLTLQKPYITFWFSKWPESSCKPPSGGIRRHQDSHLLTLTPQRAWNPKERLHLWALQALPLPPTHTPQTWRPQVLCGCEKKWQAGTSFAFESSGPDLG